MSWVAWKMLVGDKTKYLGIIFGVAFGSLLMAHQMSIFCGLMNRTRSQIDDVYEADIWVMDPYLQSVDEIKPLSENDLFRVRGVSGVDWAVKFYKGLARVTRTDGTYRQAILMGLDDATLVGAPKDMVKGSLEDLNRPDGVIIDKSGYEYLWPGEPLELNRTVEMNDRRAVIVGICKASPPFQTFPVIYTRYSQATRFVPQERKIVSFILAKPIKGVDEQLVCNRIREQTGLAALTRDQFGWQTIWYYIKTTGIPVNFGITVALGFIVGTAIAGQTFYLFVVENLKQFGALKAMGTSNGQLILMVLVQAAVVGLIGFGLGLGMSAAFFEATKEVSHLAGFKMLPQIIGVTAIAVLLIVVAASFLSLRRVLILEPAIVFRG